MNVAYIAGIVCGVLAVAFVCWLVSRINTKTGVEKKPYDERQRALRDRGYKYAYLTLIGYMVILAFIHAFELIEGELSGWLFIGVIVSLLVHVVYSIYNDAYFRISDSPRGFTALFTVLGASNIVLGVLKRVNGEVEGAFPTYGDLNLIVGVMLLVTSVNILIKQALDKRAEEN